MTATIDNWTWEQLAPKAPTPAPAPNPPARPSVPDALAALTYGTDDVAMIAHRLLAGGWTGHKAETDSCPVARYLHDLTGRNVDVVGDYVDVWAESGDLDDDVPLPLPVRMFVRMFDAGCFPDLIK